MLGQSSNLSRLPVGVDFDQRRGIQLRPNVVLQQLGITIPQFPDRGGFHVLQQCSTYAGWISRDFRASTG